VLCSSQQLNSRRGQNAACPSLSRPCGGGRGVVTPMMALCIEFGISRKTAVPQSTEEQGRAGRFHEEPQRGRRAGSYAECPRWVLTRIPLQRSYVSFRRLRATLRGLFCTDSPYSIGL
jgi:hypothetical protein